jgi:hypothetical protein
MDVPRSEEEREAYYLREITRRTPPSNHHDELMLRVYRNLLRSVRDLKRLEEARGARIPSAQ